MVENTVILNVRKYLIRLKEKGIDCFGIIYGSMVNGSFNQYSDIDLIVVSPSFDGAFSRSLINTLWRTAAITDSRIEPVPCGEKQWITDNITPVLETGRRGGLIVKIENYEDID